MGRASPIWSLGFAMRRLSGAVGRASLIWSLGFATRRLSGAMGLSAFSHWASLIWASRRGGGLWVRWVCGVCGFFAVMVFVGLLGLRWINGVCCDGVCGFAGFFLWWFAVD
jgi:hypothetical protein